MSFFTRTLVLSLLALQCCNAKKKKDVQKNEIEMEGILSYDINQPLEKIKLPNSLREISGLTLYDDNTAICVNDEEGKIFILDLSSKEITKKLKFGGSGDYEGIEVVDNDIYVIKSNGKVTKFSLSKEFEINETEEFDLPFSSQNDIEGLGYNKSKNLLIIVPKASSNTKFSKSKGKSVFGFDIVNRVLLEEPILTISQKEFESKTGSQKFSASGVAYHKEQKSYYMIASAGKRIIKVNELGEILETQKIDSKILKQPEGIAFDEMGDLYISSEGKEGKGYILKFKKTI